MIFRVAFRRPNILLVVRAAVLDTRLGLRGFLVVTRRLRSPEDLVVDVAGGHEISRITCDFCGKCSLREEWMLGGNDRDLPRCSRAE